MTDLAVDPQALATLAARLSRIRENVKALPGFVQGGAEALGDGDLADRLRSFVDGWRDGRQAIEDDITQVLGFLQGAAQTYASHDDQLAAAIQQADGGGG